MNFDLILEYQKIDQDINALNAKISGSEEAKRYTVAKARFEEDKVRANKLKEQGNSLIASYDDMQKKIDALKSSLDEFDGVVEDMQDMEEADYCLKRINAICSEIAALEKELNDCAKKADEIGEQYAVVLARGKKEYAECESAKLAGQEFVAPIQAEINALKAKRDALAPSIDQKILETYVNVRKTQKLPVVVQYKGTGGCPRCGMMDRSFAKLVNAGDYMECPNCRRLLFIPEK